MLRGGIGYTVERRNMTHTERDHVRVGGGDGGSSEGYKSVLKISSQSYFFAISGFKTTELHCQDGYLHTILLAPQQILLTTYETWLQILQRQILLC